MTSPLQHQLVLDDDLHLGLLYDLLINNPPEIRRAIRALAYDHVIAQKFNSSQSRSTGGLGKQVKAEQGGWENEGGTTSQLDAAAGLETEELFDFV
nr:sister-chromatid cohesion protein 3 [Tanacetum cinerariifolium]